jgi:hypothetical protein
MKVNCTIRNVATTYDQKLRFRKPYRKSTFTVGTYAPRRARFRIKENRGRGTIAEHPLDLK